MWNYEIVKKIRNKRSIEETLKNKIENEISNLENTVGTDKDYIEFTANGTFNDVIYSINASNVCGVETAQAVS